MLALVGLPEQGIKYPAQLSGGQQQRVALARALATSPGLLLLDEPLSALDARVRVRLRDEIKSLQRRLGVTTIMVTHDQEEAMSMADRIVVMNQGVIEQVGTPPEIYAHPTTAFVADFIGHMVFLDGVVAANGGGRCAWSCVCCVPDRRWSRRARVCVSACDRRKCRCAASWPSTPNRIEVRVTAGDLPRLVLPVDAEAVAHPGLTITADLSSNDVRDLDVAVGHTIAIALPPEQLRVFAAGARV